MKNKLKLFVLLYVLSVLLVSLFSGCVPKHSSLKIDSVTYCPSHTEEGDFVTFELTIESEKQPPISDYYVFTYIDGNLFNKTKGKQLAKSDKTESLSLIKEWKALSGKHTVKFVIKAHNKVINTRTITLSVKHVPQGKLVWKLHPGDHSYLAPLVCNDKIVFYSSTTVYCLSPDNGKLLWKRNFITDSDNKNPNGIIATVGYNRKIYISLHDKGVKKNSAVSTLYCLDINNGKTLWKKRIYDGIAFDIRPYSNNIYVTVFYEDIFGPIPDKTLYCFDSKNGNLIWKKNFYRVGQFPFQAFNGKLFISVQDKTLSTTYIACFDAKNGALLWKKSVGDLPSLSLSAADNGKLFFVSSDLDYITAMDDKGDLMWKKKIINSANYVISAFNGKLYVSALNSFYCMDERNGNVIWQYVRKNCDFASLANGRENLYVRVICRYFDYLLCIDEKTGKLRWKFSTKDTISAPVFYNGKVYFGSDNGYAYCVEGGK